MDFIYLLILVLAGAGSMVLGAKLIVANREIKRLTSYIAVAEKVIDEMTIDEYGLRVGDAVSWRNAAREAQDIAAERGRELATLQDLWESHLKICRPYARVE